MRKILIAAAAFAAATPAIAQVGNSQGLIPIQIQNVDILKNFLNDTQVAALNNVHAPVTVQVPISVAANICGTSVAALADQRKSGQAGCTADSGSQALADAFARQHLKQNK